MSQPDLTDHIIDLMASGRIAQARAVIDDLVQRSGVDVAKRLRRRAKVLTALEPEAATALCEVAEELERASA